MTDQNPEDVETVPADDPLMTALATLLDGGLGKAPEEGTAETSGPARLVAPEGSACQGDPIYEDAKHGDDVSYVLAILEGGLYYSQFPPVMLAMAKQQVHRDYHAAEEGSEVKEQLRKTYFVIMAVETMIEAMRGGAQG